MHSAGLGSVHHTPSGLAKDPRTLLAIFTATIFLSALLLFAVQPMFAKLVLPSLGGSPSVWAVTMVFFQGVLLAGYGYAWALNRLLSPARAVVAHVVLLAVAALLLPVGLPSGLSEPPVNGATVWLLGVLLAGVGLPFFALSANAPLLQSWFARTGHPHAVDPYFLYAASNVGSLAALLAYPVVVEPMLRLTTQGALWSGLFLVLGLAIAASGALTIANMRAPCGPCTVADENHRPIGARDRLTWIAFAFVPSALLVAFTTYVSTDIASAPLLWVVPLAVFLATFTLVFRREPVIPHSALLDRQPMLAAFAIFATPTVGQLPFGIGYVAAFLAFIVTCLVCHRELYERRPSTGQLTEFYMWMSLGGVLGGMFAALAAPTLFNTVIEFPLLLAASVWLRPQIVDGGARRADWLRPALALAGGIATLLILRSLIGAGVLAASSRLYLACVAAPFALLFLWRHDPRRQIAAVATMAAAVLLLPADGTNSHAVRSFFGVHRIVDDGAFRLLKHGTTVHGAQRLVDDSGQRIDRPVPATYYHPSAPMTRAAELVRRPGQAPSFGIVGLGSGAMACNARAHESWSFFEIDQAVVDIARDKSHFTYLASCLPDARIVVGDARLTLVREPRAAYDLLLVDAFSSDSIPTHLLTVDAARLYLEKLKPDGLLAFHISNRHLDLVPVVAANMAALPGMTAVVVRDEPAPSGYDATPSVVVLASRDEERLAQALNWRGAERLTAGNVRAWTDDYSDILSALARGLMR